MKIDLEDQDIDRITQKVVDVLKPFIRTDRDPAVDGILDMEGLCSYLKVTSKWVHERTHLKEIPFIKLSNKQLRFRKRDIDKWLESLRTPAINPLSSRMKLMK
jgi:excisionase family DNA binding protein